MRKKDKIFDNTYNSSEGFNTQPISFSKDSVYSEERLDDAVDRDMVMDRIAEVVDGCDWAVEVLDRDDAQKRVTKREANDVFKFIHERTGGQNSVEVFDYMSSRMDFDTPKLYDYMSNSVKEELHAELRRRGFLGDAGEGRQIALP